MSENFQLILRLPDWQIRFQALSDFWTKIGKWKCVLATHTDFSNSYIFANFLIFQTMNSVRSNILSLKYQRLTLTVQGYMD